MVLNKLNLQPAPNADFSYWKLSPVSKRKVCLIGQNGFLGGAILRQHPGLVRSANIDILDRRQVQKMISELKPEIIINAAGKTGKPNVDWCEVNQAETSATNVGGPALLAEECSRNGILLVQFGTGCMYSGDNGGVGFSEDSPPNFFGSHYSRTKVELERVLEGFPVLLLRPRMPFNGSNHFRNLIVKLSGYKSVVDVPNSITSVDDLISAMWHLIQKGATGKFNIVNDGVISPSEIADLYQEIIDPQHKFESISAKQLDRLTLAARSMCVLSGKKLNDTGWIMPPVHVAVRKALEQFKSSSLNVEGLKRKPVTMTAFQSETHIENVGV